MLGDLVKQLDRRFGFALVYCTFGLLSLLVAVVLFGILRSTGVLQLVLEGYVKQAEFGGAFAGFLATLIFLVKSYNSVVDRGRYHITGTVYSKDELPAEGATVFVEGWNFEGKTNAVGHFQVEVRAQAEWTVGAHLGEAKAPAVTVKQQDVETPIRLLLDKSKAQLRTSNVASPRLIRHKVK